MKQTNVPDELLLAMYLALRAAQERFTAIFITNDDLREFLGMPAKGEKIKQTDASTVR